MVVSNFSVANTAVKNMLVPESLLAFVITEEGRMYSGKRRCQVEGYVTVLRFTRHTFHLL